MQNKQKKKGYQCGMKFIREDILLEKLSLW